LIRQSLIVGNEGGAIVGENRITVRRPLLPPLEFLSDPSYSIRSDCGRALVSYDPMTRTGFVYHLAEQVWSIVTPLDFKDFLASLQQEGHAITDSADARRWRAACDPEATSNVITLHGKTRH